MKRNTLFGFFAGLMLMALVGFNTSDSFLTVKPAKPKSTAVVYKVSEAMSYIRQGYQIHEATGVGAYGRDTWIMVKY